MVDRLISRGLSTIIMGMITLTFGSALLLVYRAFFELLAAHWIGGASRIGVAIPLAFASRMLILHKDDLMDK